MKTILLTGGTGFVGKCFRARFSDRFRIVGLSRRRVPEEGEWVRGDFASFEDLRQLDNVQIDAVVHLAAVTGGCLEREGILVNVEGTRCLMRYAADRGCGRFVLASSIATVGIEDPAFVPTTLPMLESEPCADRHGYGFSKHLMEEVSLYHARRHPDHQVFNLRLGALKAAGSEISPMPQRDRGGWWFAGLGQLSVEDAVSAIGLALEVALPPGVHTYFIGPPKSTTSIPVAELVSIAFGADAPDLSHYSRPGHEHDPVYSIDKARRELGYEPGDLPEWM